MAIEVGSYVYTQRLSKPDGVGVKWVTVWRHLIKEVDGESVQLGGGEVADFPEHSPPNPIPWNTPPHAPPFSANVSYVKTQFLGQLDLSEPYQFADEQEVIEARNTYRNQCYVSSELGRPNRKLSDEQAFQFAVLDWRYPW